MLSNTLSILAIIISGFTALYTYKQSVVITEQYEKQKKLEEELSSYSIVVGYETDKNLIKSIQNGQLVYFSFSNGSIRPVPYSVEIKSQGIGLFHEHGKPDKIYNNYPLNRKRSTLIQPNGHPYKGVFSLWHFQKPAPLAKVSIWINGEEAASYSYRYNNKTKKYDYIYD